MDGSEHDWFEGRRGKASMMVMIDDTTNWTHAKFFESETTAAMMCSGVRWPLRVASLVVRGPGEHLRNHAKIRAGRSVTGHRSADAVRSRDAGVGGRVD